MKHCSFKVKLQAMIDLFELGVERGGAYFGLNKIWLQTYFRVTVCPEVLSRNIKERR